MILINNYESKYFGFFLQFLQQLVHILDLNPPFLLDRLSRLHDLNLAGRNIQGSKINLLNWCFLGFHHHREWGYFGDVEPQVAGYHRRACHF